MRRNFGCLFLLCFVLHGLPPTMRADEPVTAEQVPPQTAVASDRGDESARKVARELLQLQQQLGGSVVSDRPQLENLPTAIDIQVPTIDRRHRLQLGRPDTTLLTWPEQQALATGRRPGPARREVRPSPASKVSQLRETALLLDTKAHLLEVLDLYEQADALRAVATRLRHDARAMRRAATSNSASRP